MSLSTETILHPTLDPFIGRTEALLARVFGTKWASGLCEFLVFGIKEAGACVFAGSFLFLLAISSHVSIPGIARYDFLFLGAIAFSIVMLSLSPHCAG